MPRVRLRELEVDTLCARHELSEELPVVVVVRENGEIEA